MPLYKVLTRLLGHAPKGDNSPGDLVEMTRTDAAELVALGALDLISDDEAPGDEDADAILTALDAMTVKQLKALATAAELDLSAATKKPEIVQVLADSVDRDNADQVAAFIMMAEIAKAG